MTSLELECSQCTGLNLHCEDYSPPERLKNYAHACCMWKHLVHSQERLEKSEPSNAYLHELTAQVLEELR